jgi:hypothetical protein
MDETEDMSPMFDPDRLLADAAAMVPAPPDARFLARLMADADRLQPPMPMPAPHRPAATLPPAAQSHPAAGRGGMLGALADVFGGRGSLAAMMLATVAGLYLGVAQPAILTDLTGLYSEAPLDNLDLMSGSDSLWKVTTP